MDIDAEINAELSALSDCSLEDLESIESDKDVEGVCFSDGEKGDAQVDWMQLFLDRTCEQAKKIEDSLCDAEVVLQEINKNVDECHSQAVPVDGRGKENNEHGKGDSLTADDSDLVIENLHNNEESALLTEQQTLPSVRTNSPTKESLDVEDFNKQKLEADQHIQEFEVLCQQEMLQHFSEIEEKRLASERHMREIVEGERKILDELEREKRFYENQRKNRAACLIQTEFRRYCARRKYGAELDQRLKVAKEKRLRSRILAIEKKKEQEKRLKSASNSVDGARKSTLGSDALNDQSLEVDLHVIGQSPHVISRSPHVIGRSPHVIEELSETERSMESETNEDVNEATTYRSEEGDLTDNDSINPNNAVAETPPNPVLSSSNKDNSISFVQDESNELENRFAKSPIFFTDAENNEAELNLDRTDPVRSSNGESQSLQTNRRNIADALQRDLEILQASVVMQDDGKVRSTSLRPATESNRLDVPTANNVDKAKALLENITGDIALLQASVNLEPQPSETDVTDQLAGSGESDVKMPSELLSTDDDVSRGSFESTNSDRVTGEPERNSPGCTESSRSTPLLEHADSAKDPTTVAVQHAVADAVSAHSANTESVFSEAVKKNVVAPEDTAAVQSTTFEVVATETTLSDVVISEGAITEVVTANDEVENGRANDNFLTDLVTTGCAIKAEFNAEEADNVQDIVVNVNSANVALGSDSIKDAETKASFLANVSSKVDNIESSISKPQFATEADMKSEPAVETVTQVTNAPLVTDSSQSAPSSEVTVEKRLEIDQVSTFAASGSGSELPTATTLNHAGNREIKAQIQTADVKSKQSSGNDRSTPKAKDSNFQERCLSGSTTSSEKDSDRTPTSSNTAQDELVKAEKPTTNDVVSISTSLHNNVTLTKVSSIKDTSETDSASAGSRLASRNSSSPIEADLIPTTGGATKLRASLDAVQPDALWRQWKDLGLRWRMTPADKAWKPQLKRAIRRSSAAKKLPPLTEEEIVKGKWPYWKEAGDERTVETLSRIFIAALGDVGRNLVHLRRCVNLTHLTLLQCGLVSIEGLQACPTLRHIDFSHNDITVISCDGMKRLESLVATNNRLTSIHGLTGCRSLVLLDLSDNDITKIAGFEDTPNLAHLRLTNNQLMSVKGLKSITTLLHLDVSGNNLSSLDGVEECGLMRCVNASNNYFTAIPVENLINCVLLVDVNLSENSISELNLATNEKLLFLPFLSRLDLSRNKISMERDTPSCRISNVAPLLAEIDLSRNLVATARPLIDEIALLPRFRRMLARENLFSKPEEAEIVDDCLRRGFEITFEDAELPNKLQDAMTRTLILPFRGDVVETSTPRPLSRDQFARSVARQLDNYFELIEREAKAGKDLGGWKLSSSGPETPLSLKIPPELISCHCNYLKDHFELAIQSRTALESSRVKGDESSLLNVNVKASGQVLKETDVLLETIDSSRAFSPSLNDSVSGHRIQNPSRSRSNDDAGELSLKSRDRSSTNSAPQARHVTARRNQSAIVIQCAWRRYAARSNRRRRHLRRSRAALCIQKAWRRHLAARNRQSSFASFTLSNDDDEVDADEFAEVDLSELEFDDNAYERQWAIRTSNLPAEVLPFPPLNERDRRLRTPVNSYRNSSPNDDPSGNSQTIWQKLASISKPPLPPITPTGSVGNSERTYSPATTDRSYTHIDSQRSKHSKKEELLASEWGLRSSGAAALMLKRAKRMRGRKKKEVNADEKLRRFHDLKQKVSEKPLVTARKPSSQPLNRVEYFKARETEFNETEKKPSENDEQRRQYTYEWLHTSANVSENNSAPRRGHHSLPLVAARGQRSDSASIKSGFLPHIPHQRHVTSPQQFSDLEVLSLSSRDTSGHPRSKHLLREIARRHGEVTSSDLRR